MEMRKTFGSNVRFMLMNSFSTSDDTLNFLQKYPELSNDPNLELVQVRFVPFPFLVPSTRMHACITMYADPPMCRNTVRSLAQSKSQFGTSCDEPWSHF